MVQTAEEKAEVRHAFFASTSNIQMGYVEDKQSPEPAHREGSRPEPRQSRGKSPVTCGAT